MGLPAITDELTSLTSFLPSTGGMPASGVAVALVGDALSVLTVASTLGATSTVTLTRRPATSAAAVASSAFTADVAGLYTVTVAAGGVTKTYSVFAFPVAHTTTAINAGQPGPAKTYNRAHLSAWVAQGVTAAQLATLETIPAPNLGMLGGIAGMANV